MNVLQEKRPFQERDAISSLETVDVATGQCTVLKEFDHLIEAPNWLPTGDRLLYNAGGRLWLFDLATGESRQIDTGFACRCNNDHVLSPDGRSVGLSQGTAEDGWSRVYTVPLEGGVPRLITPIAPSYLHGWSPCGKKLAFVRYRLKE